MKKAALYIRVSTEEQAVHGLSIEAQTVALDAWAKNNGIVVYDHYIDEGISARKPASKRPELQRLLNDARSGKINLIAFTKLDRWFRNISEYYKVQEVLEKNNVDWKTIYEDYDTSTASGRLKINIMLSVAQDEADRTSERIKAVYEIKRQKKEPLTGNEPTGYLIEGKKFIKNPDLEPVIDAFFQKFISCGSVGETQDYIREQFGILWKYHVIDKLLSSTAYYGYYYGVEDMCPPYITKDQYDQIQTMRKKVTRKPLDKKRVYMFSGLLSCGECGYRLGGRTQRTSRYPTYNCAQRYMQKICTNNNTISENKIEQFIIDTLDSKLQQYIIAVETLKQTERTRDFDGEISAIKSKMNRLKNLYIDEFISIEEYKQDYEKYQKHLTTVEEEKKNSQQPPDLSQIKSLLASNWKETYSELDRASQREFWRSIIGEIRFYKDRHIEYDLK